MICVGIDAAADKHDVCIARDTGEQFGKVFRIRNRIEDYKKLLERIEAAKEHFHDAKVRLGIESTGSYSAVLLEFLAKEDGLEVVLINPILTSMYQQLRKVHYAKTDTIDATGIASFIASSQTVRTYTPPSYHVRTLKEMYRELMAIDKDLCESKNRLKSLLHRYFPEYLDVFGDICLKASLYVLGTCSDFRKYLNKDAGSLMRRINSKSGGNITEKKVTALQKAIEETVGDLDSFSYAVVHAVARRIQLYLDEKEELVGKMRPIVEDEAPELLTVPGISTTVAAGIISEIVCIGNFQNADQLVAYAGLDPIVYESGQYKATGTRISKKGSAYLREALYMASFTVAQHCEPIREYYIKKISEGKKHRVVLGHVAKKLCRLIFCLLSKHKPYVPPAARTEGL